MYRKTLITTILCMILCIQFGQGTEHINKNKYSN